MILYKINISIFIFNKCLVDYSNKWFIKIYNTFLNVNADL